MRCYLLVKFALLDDSDKKAVELFKNEVKSQSKTLSKDFKDKKLKVGKYGCKIIKTPYMCLGTNVFFYKEYMMNRRRKAYKKHWEYKNN